VQSIVVDAGPLVALLKRRDRDRARVSRFPRVNQCALLTTWPVLVEKNRDRPMDMADASLVVLAERPGVTEIPTIGRADFYVYRLSGNRRFVQVLAA
jgi:hypothetical protein